MKKLLEEIQELKSGPVKKIIDARIKEFQKVGEKCSSDLFKELCFCIMTANCSAEICIRVQNEINEGFLTLPEKKLANRLKEVGL
ncbi:MAG: 8-oxoguanine DNA glycosylase [Candidatus Helarchaeota archaeon]